MKRIGLFFLMIVFMVTAGVAQPGQGGGRQFNPEDMAKRQTEQIGEYVKYTAGQDVKVYAVNLKYAKKMQEMRGQGGFRDMSDSQRAEMRKKMEAQQLEKDKEMKLIFTEAQYKQYEVYKADMEKRRQERMQGRQ